MEAALHLLRRQLIDESNDENIGSSQREAQDPKNSTISGLVSTLVLNLLIFAAFILIFILLRRTNKRIYAPRTYVSTIEKWRRLKVQDDDGDGYADEVEGVRGFSGLIGWAKAVWALPDETVLKTNGLDGYFFLRYLRKAQMICFVGCCFTVPILVPINATGKGGRGGLDVIAFGNVAEEEKNRYYAHVFVSWLFYGFVLFTIYRELIYYITMRQAYMLSPMYANRISARTVLITTIPTAYQNETALRRMFDNVKRIWVATDCKKLADMVEERDKIVMRLEAAEVKLIKLADKARNKAGASPDNKQPDGAEVGGESGSVAAQWLPRKKRPTHKLKPLIGEKVDTIDWCRQKLAELNPQIEEMQSEFRAGEGKKLSAAFIEFTSQAAAQVAFQTLQHHKPLHMAPRYIGVTPGEVVWNNLRLFWWERLVKFAITTSFIVALVIFWSLPVAVVGVISNVTYLTEKLTWLRWINDIPDVILGVITGLLPVVALAVLMALLPIIMRLMAKISGVPSLSAIELRTQNSYFLFQVIQVFLVTTISSSASSAIPQIIKRPEAATNLLAESLPTAANFYVSFMILQGLSVAASTMVQLVGLIVYRVLGAILDTTPRKQWTRWSSLTGVGWGTVFPIYTNICVIALTYAVIAPLVLLFATIGLGLLYFAYRYNFLFVYNVNIDTKGLVYPRALYQTMTGVYLAEICLIGLFAIAKAIGPLILQIVFLIATILFHVTLNDAVSPLLHYLPKNLQVEEEALLSLESGTQSPHPVDSKSSDPSGRRLSAHHDSHPYSGTQPISRTEAEEAADVPSASPAPKKPANFLSRFLSPDTYENYSELRKRLPLKEAPEVRYQPEDERDAYFHPAVKSEPMEIWVPRDEGGVSRQECQHTGRVNGISDEGAVVEQGKVKWIEGVMPPGWRENVVY